MAPWRWSADGGSASRISAPCLSGGIFSAAANVTTTRVSVDGWPLEQRALAQSKVLGGLGKSLSLGIKSTRTKAERIVVHKSEQP